MNTKKPSNPPAFPNNEQAHDSYGMDLRDYFAAKAMQSIIINSSKTTAKSGLYDSVAALSYKIADAMLVERNKQS